MAKTKAEVLAVIDAHPLLHDGGYGTHGRRNEGPTADEMEQWRRRLMSDSSMDEIIRACDWVDSHFEKRKTINDRHTSYGLKHMMEYETRKTGGGAGFYTSNGQL